MRQRAGRDDQRVIQKSIESVEFATLEWFHIRRLMEPIGNVPPAELETQYDDQTIGSAIAA